MKRKRSTKKAAVKKSGKVITSKKKATPKRVAKGPKHATFLGAFRSLLDSRGIDVPDGFDGAPPEAYATQPAEVVELLTKLTDEDLRNQAERIAGYSERKASRARAAWNTSPLIVELRQRGLKEPAAPDRVVGAAIHYRKPLHEWTDEEIVAAATEWSGRGSNSYTPRK